MSSTNLSEGSVRLNGAIPYSSSPVSPFACISLSAWFMKVTSGPLIDESQPVKCAYALNASAGSGGDIECRTGGTRGTVVSCTGTFDGDTVITITADPDDTHTFGDWSGCDSVSDDDVCTVTMAAAKTVTASFTAKPTRTLTTSVSPPGGGLVSASTRAVAGQNDGFLGGFRTWTFLDGDTVHLRARPNQGYVFSQWAGNASGTSATTTIVMNANKTATAIFAVVPTPTPTPTATATPEPEPEPDPDPTQEPTPEPIPQCSLSVTVNPPTASSGSASVTGDCGSLLTVSAPQAASGYEFTGWSTPCSGKGSCSVTVGTSTGSPRTTTVTANYSRITYVLTTGVSPAGGGSISGGGTYNSGTRVTVTANPASGWRFTGWSGACSGTSTCSVLMNGPKSVTASFTRITYVLSTGVSPAGGGSVSGGGTYNSGTRVTVTANPASGWRFTGWSGACSGTSTCSVLMNGPKSVTASFTRITYVLSTGVSPAGGGSISGGGTYNSGTRVVVTANPTSGWRFTGWSGACSGTGSCSVLMNGPKSVTASFVRITYVLTTGVLPAGGGSVSGGGTYNSGTRVSVTANPTSGWRFIGWSGACSGTGTCSVLMNGGNERHRHGHAHPRLLRWLVRLRPRDRQGLYRDHEQPPLRHRHLLPLRRILRG